jgi:hypothetical protein
MSGSDHDTLLGMKKAVLLACCVIALLCVGVVSYVKARDRSQWAACIGNLRQLEGAKSQVAINLDLKKDDTMDSEERLKEFFGLLDGQMECPSGGTYTINPIGVEATCSLGESMNHQLPGF